MHLYKEAGVRTAKLALLLIRFMKSGIVQFLLYEHLEKSKLGIYTKHSSLIINLHEQHMYIYLNLFNFLI